MRRPGAVGLGFAADRAFGDPVRLHPVAGFGTAAAWAERRVWRASRLVGTVYVAALVAAVWAATAVLARRLPASACAVLWATLGGRSLERAALELQAALDGGDLAGARELAPTLVGRDPSALDGDELARAAIESVAENVSDAVVAPLVWMAAIGPAGAAAYRAINTLDAMVGHRDERHLRFGWAAARLDDAANWVPARMTALLVVALASGRRRATWHAAFCDGARHPSPNAGRAEGAFAGALDVRLGGVNRYSHGVEERPQLGDGAPPRSGDIARAAALARRVGVAAAVVAAGAAGMTERRAARIARSGRRPRADGRRAAGATA